MGRASLVPSVRQPTSPPLHLKVGEGCEVLRGVRDTVTHTRSVTIDSRIFGKRNGHSIQLTSGIGHSL